MMRTTIIPDKQDISIHLPHDYIGKRIEVLLYATDELEPEESLQTKKSTNLRGKLDLTDDEYNDFRSHINDIRNEWNKDI